MDVMPEILIPVLAVAALLVGATGTWSPCGFSMVETLGPGGHTGGRQTTAAACATFLPGAIVGALFTFGGLAMLGSLIHGAGSTVALVAAAMIALLAAVAEVRGVRIAPQIRRQLPEHWRRVMPMPVAAALYGMLLGLGFTTFVLTFGVWALAGISFALGVPEAGLAIGLGFGIGRALPVIAIAPIADRPLGQRLLTLMAERPGLYRGIRAADAMALLAAALVIGAATPALAEEPSDSTSPVPEAPTGATSPDEPLDESTVPDESVDEATDEATDENADDPGADPAANSPVSRMNAAANPATGPDGAFAFQRKSGKKSVVVVGGQSTTYDGSSPAFGPGMVLLARSKAVQILNSETGEVMGSFSAPGVDAVAASSEWVAYRVRQKGKDAIFVRQLNLDGTVDAKRRIVRSNRRGHLSRPSLNGSRLVYAVNRPTYSRILIKPLDGGSVIRARNSTSAVLTAPSLGDQQLAFVVTNRGGYELRLRNLGGGSERALRKTKHNRPLTSTAIGESRVYVTVQSGKKPNPRIISNRP